MVQIIDPDWIEQRCLKLLQLSLSHNQLCIRARQKVKQQFTWELQAQKYSELYSDILSKSNGYSAFHVTEVSTSFANKGFKPLAHASF
ncbi:hypothetical protein B5D77_02440 [Microcystis sp. MC19]|nr:hypothetical protein B5D77_02440 [Microcystis sp. MC19]